MEPYRDDPELSVALLLLKPAPQPEFAAELDARVAAGFPRAGKEGPLARLRNRLGAIPPRRVLAPAGALALTAIVISTAVVAISEERPTEPRTLFADPSDAAAGQRLSGSGEAATHPKPFSTPAEAAERGDSSGIQYAEAPSTATGETSPARGRLGGRDIERAAQIVLGADPADVRGDAAKVFDAVHAANGIVLRSSIRDGSAGDAGAEFELLIPSGKLGDALADFSRIDEVRSRRESTQDITAPTVGARERLQDSGATIEGLLGQLSAATTDAERTATEAKLRAERRQAAFFAAQLDRLNRRADLSRLSLRIETGAGVASDEDGGAWGVGDGLDDAGRILEIAAGVTIVGLAILTPLALIAFLAWPAHRTWIRTRRAQALR